MKIDQITEDAEPMDREFALVKKLGRLGERVAQNPRLWEKYTEAVDSNNLDWIVSLIQEGTGADKTEVMHLSDLFGEIGGGLGRLEDFAWAVKEGTWQQDFMTPYRQHRSQDLNEFAPAGGGNTPRGPRTPGGDFGGGDDSGKDPYRRPEPEYYSRSIDYFGQFEADHFDDEEFDKDTGVFKGYWDDAEGRVQIGYFKFDDPAATGSDDPGMGWYYEPQNESVAEDSLNEFAPGSGGGESGRWYTDDQMTDIVGDGWYEDMDVSGDVPKDYMIQQAQAWLDDQGYSVQVLNCRLNDDDMDWYIEGNFHNPGFAKKGVAEGSLEEIDRRGFLRGLGAAAVVGAAGSAMAQTMPNINAQQVELANKYYNALVQRAKEDGRELDTRTLNFLRAKAQEAAAKKLQQNNTQANAQQGFPTQGSERRVAKDAGKFESQGVAEGANADSQIKRIKDRILQLKDWNTAGTHDKKIKELQAKLKELQKQGVAEGIDDEDYGPELDALKKEFSKFTTHYDRMDQDPAYAAQWRKQNTDRLNREVPNNDHYADATDNIGHDMGGDDEDIMRETKPREKEADYGDDYQDMVARVKKLAGLGPLRTVYDPQKRVYKNVPVAVQPPQQPKK